MDVKQLIDDSSNSEIISVNKKFAQKVNNYYANIVNSYGEYFFDSSAFENSMSSANVSKPFKFSPVTCSPSKRLFVRSKFRRRVTIKFHLKLYKNYLIYWVQS